MDPFNIILPVSEATMTTKLPASAVLSSDTLHDSYSVGDKRTAAILCQLRVVRYVQDYGCSLDAGSNDSSSA
jgi:hypothetical protein